MPSQTTRSDCDWPGIVLLLFAGLATPALVLFAPPAAFPLSVFGFVVLHFSGHAATHRSLFRVRGPAAVVLNEALLFAAFTPQLLNYQVLSAAHMNHHALGRNSGDNPDVVSGRRSLTTHTVYYGRLLFAQYAYWVCASLFSAMVGPTKRTIRAGRVGMRFVLPRAVPQIGIAVFAVLALSINAAHAVFYFLTCGLLWSLNQNVAHHGLKGWDAWSAAVAARTYLVDPITERITYGSLSHLAHHVFPRRSGRDLQSECTLEAAGKRLGGTVSIAGGLGAFFRDLLVLQMNGPMEESQQNTSWISLETER